MTRQPSEGRITISVSEVNDDERLTILDVPVPAGSQSALTLGRPSHIRGVVGDAGMPLITGSWSLTAAAKLGSWSTKS
jgi:hypothetical protein